MCIETAFFRYTAGCRMFFLSLVFISLNRKGTLESIRECLYKGCFPILYKLTSSVREKQHFFLQKFCICSSSISFSSNFLVKARAKFFHEKNGFRKLFTFFYI